MLRYPLHVPILLITTGGKFIGRITHASDEFVRLVDVVEKVFVGNEFTLYTDDEIGGVVHLERSHIIGYKALDGREGFFNEREYSKKLKEEYQQELSNYSRSQLKIVKPSKK